MTSSTDVDGRRNRLQLVAYLLATVHVTAPNGTLVDQLWGAVHALRSAIALGPETTHAGAGYARAVLLPTVHVLVNEESPPLDWLANFHAESALHRIANFADRFARLLGEDRERCWSGESSVEAVHRLVSGDGTSLHGGTALDLAIDALDAEVQRARATWPRHRGAGAL